MEVLSPYEAKVDGKTRRYLFPKWTWKNDEYVRIDTDSKVEVETGVGKSVIHDKLYNTVGYRTDGNHEKFVGLRPGRYQSGDYQVEFSIRSACINETDVPLVTNNPRRIDKHHVSLGNVIVENHRGWHRQMIEVPDEVASVNDFCVEYEILLKGYHLPDATETTRVIRPTCGFFELGSVEELSTFNSLSVCIFDDSIANNVVYIRGNKWEDVIPHNSYFQQFVTRFASETQRVIDERERRDALVSANAAISFSEGLHKSTISDSSIGLIGCEWIDEYTFRYDVRDVNYDLNALRSIVESVSEISDSTVGELRCIPDDELTDLSEYVISNPVVMDERFNSLNTGNYHTLKRVDNRWIYTKYAGWGYIISDVRERVKYIDLTINSHNFYDGGNPYSVDSQDDIEAMMAIGTTTTGSNTTTDWHKKHYIMENDIDMSGATTSPIWQDTTGDGFRGTFNGNGYAIKNLTLISNTKGVGLFGYISGEGGAGIVRNLTISGNCTIHGHFPSNTNVSADMYGVGVFAGVVYGKTPAFENCVLSMYGDLSKAKGFGNCGGFVGLVIGACKFRNCVNMMTGSIMGHSNLGGFVGYWKGHSTYTPSTEPENALIENCTQSMLGNITTYHQGGGACGGFIGVTHQEQYSYYIGTIKNCILSMCGEIYANVWAGGFIGRSTKTDGAVGGKWIINACRQEMHGSICSCRHASQGCGAGGFVGSGTNIIYNSLLLMKGDIIGEAFTGGFLGLSSGGTIIRNCINAMVGNIWSSHPAAGWADTGGFIGKAGNNNTEVTNCIQMMIGFITGYNTATFIARVNGSSCKLTNCMQIGRIYSRAPTMASWEGSSYVEYEGDLPWTYGNSSDSHRPDVSGSVKFLPCSDTYYSISASALGANKRPTKQDSVITDLTNYLTAGWDKTNKINGIFPRLLYNQSVPSTTNGNSYSYILPNVVPMLGSSSNFVPKQDFYRVVHGAKYCKFTNRSMGSSTNTEPANTSCDGYLFKSKNWTPTHCEYIAATENGNSTSSNYLKMKKILITPGNVTQYSTSGNSYVLGENEGKAIPYAAGIWADSFSVNTPSTQTDTIGFPPFINGKRAYMGWSTFKSGGSGGFKSTQILCESTDPKIINDAWDWLEDNYPNNVIQDNNYDVHYIWGWKTSLYRDEGEYNFASRQYAVHNVSKVKVWKHENIEPGQDDGTSEFDKGGLNLAEVRLFDASGTNVALRKDAYRWTEINLDGSYYPSGISSKASYNSSTDVVTLSNMTEALGIKLFDWVAIKNYATTTYLDWSSYTIDQKYEIINEFMRNWRAGRTSWLSANNLSSDTNIKAVSVLSSSSYAFRIFGHSDFTVRNPDWHGGRDYGRYLFYNGSIYQRTSSNNNENVSALNTTYNIDTNVQDFFIPHELYPNINIPHARWYIGNGSDQGSGAYDPNNIINGTTQLVHDSYGGTENVYASTVHSADGGISTQCGGIEISLNGAYDINRIEIVHRSGQEVRVNGLKFQFIDADGNNISAADFMIPDGSIHEGDSNTTFNPRHKSLELYPVMNDGPFVLSQTAFDYSTLDKTSSVELVTSSLYLYYHWDSGTTNIVDSTRTPASLGSNISIDSTNGYFNFNNSGNGSNCINVGSVDLQQDWSLEIWVNFDDVSGHKGLFGHGGHSNNGGLHIELRNGAIHYGMYANDTNYTPSPAFVTGRWYHFVFTYTDSTGLKKIYVDGLNVKQADQNSYSGTGNLSIGKGYHPGISAGMLDGKVTRFRMYTKVLSSAEIEQNYNTGKLWVQQPNTFRTNQLIDYDKRVLLITPDEKLPQITFNTPNFAWNAPYTITIGSNTDGALTKSALLPYEGMTVSPVPVNSSHPRFKVDVYGNLLTVRREGHCKRPKYYYEFRGNYSSPITDEIGGSLQVTANTVSGTNISFGHDGAYFSNDTAVGYSVSYLNFPDVTLPASNNGSLSLEFYIKHESFGGGNWSRVFDFQDADYTGDATIAFFKSSTDDFVFMIRTENNDGNGSSDSQIYHEDVQTGVWYHYVLTISKNSGNNSTMKMYVDGKLNSSKTDAIVLPSLQRVNHYFSRSAWWPAQGATEPNIGGFDGWLAFFRIWDDTALSADEVKTLYEDRLFPRVGSSAWTENGIGWTQEVEFNAIKSNGYVGGRLIKQRYNGYFGANSSGPKNTLDTRNQYGNGSVDKLPHGEDGNNTNSGSDVVFSNPENSAIAEGSIDFSLNAEDYFSYKWTGFFQPPMTDNFVATRSSSAHSGVIHEVCMHTESYNSNPAALYNFRTTSDDASYMLMFGPEGRRSGVGDAKVSIDIDYSPVIHGGKHGSSSRESSQLTSANGRYTTSSNNPSYREGNGLMLWKYVRYPVQILFGEWAGGETMKFEWKGPATTIVNSQISMGYPSNLSNGSYTTNLSAAFHCETWEQIAVSNHFILGDNMRENDVPTAERGLRLQYYDGTPNFNGSLIVGTSNFTNERARAWFDVNSHSESEQIVSYIDYGDGTDGAGSGAQAWSNIGITISNAFSLKFTGFFRAPSTAIYTFRLNSDDFSLLYIDNRLIVDNNREGDGGQGALDNGNEIFVIGNMSMFKGKHYPIELLYSERTGGQKIQFDWKGGSQTSYTTSLSGGQFYYSGVVLDDKKTIQNLGTARYRAEQEFFNATSTVLGFVGSLDDDSHTVTKVRVITTAAVATNLVELQVWVGNTNIALASNNATAQTGNLSSGTHNLSHSSGYYTPDNLIDGGLSASLDSSSSMYHQHNIAADEYIEVVFDSSFNISDLQEIVVINRASNLDRYDNTKIQLYNGTTLVTSYDNNDGITSPEVIIYRQSYSSSAESWRSSNSMTGYHKSLKIIKMAPVSNDSSYGYNRIETDHQVYHDASWNYQVGKNTIMHDTSAPTITITGSSIVTLELNSKYTINRATATDTYDRTIPISITSNKAIDTGIDGSSYLVTYTATDSSNNISTATRVINISANNNTEATITGGTSGSGNEDTQITGTITATDPEGLTDGTVFTIASQTSNGTAAINASSGAWTYDPNANFNGTDTFTVTITDDSDGTTDTTVTITVISVDDAATIGGDTSKTGDEDTTITGTVTATDPEGLTDGTIFTIASQTSNGTAAINTSNGAWTYTPNTNFNGTDSFSITVTDDLGGTTDTTVNIIVTAVDDPATLSGDGVRLTSDSNITGNEDTIISGTVTATDPEGLTDGTIFSIASQTSDGTVSINAATGVWTYEPDANFNGEDTFTIRVTDDLGGTTNQFGYGSGSTTIKIVVVAINDEATISGDTSGTGDEDTQITGTLTATDTVDGLTNENIFSITTDASNGTTTINAASGAWTYDPNNNFNGTDQFTVTITDDDSHTQTQIVSLTINSVNDAVEIEGDTSGTGDEDTQITGTLTVSDNDGLTNEDIFSITTGASNGTAAINATSGAWTYDPNANFNGTDQFTVTVTDDDGFTATQIVSLTINAVNDSATISGDTSGTGDEDTQITGTLDVTDTADGLTNNNIFSITSEASNGTAAINATSGAWTYDPDANFNGTDQFTVTITDDDSHTQTQIISLTLSPVNDSATISGDTSGVGNEDNQVTGTLDVTDTADGLTNNNIFSITSEASNGTAAINAASGAWTYDPDANFHGTDQFTVTITDDDSHTETQIISITINSVNDPTTIGGDTSGTGNEDTQITGTLDVTDTADGLTNNSVFSITTGASNGTAAINATSGAWTYDPNANYNGTDSFTVTITDDDGFTATQVISLTINKVDDPVTIGGDTSATGGETITGTLTATDNADGLLDGTIFTIQTQPARGTASINASSGAWSYTLSNSNINYVGSDSFVVRVTDDDGHTADQTVSLTIIDLNPPVITIAAGSGDWINYIISGSAAETTSNHTIQVARTSINKYTEQGATAVDGVDGNRTVTISGNGDSPYVDTSNANDNNDSTNYNTYVVTYTANDTSGNVRIRTKTIIVVDDELPILTINAGYGTAERISGWNGSDSTANVVITLNQSTTNLYIEKGFRITDEGEDGESTSLSISEYGVISPNKTVTTTTVGSYLVTYTAEDVAGNETIRTKTINVVDRVGPVITLNGSRVTYVMSCSAVGAVYDDPGIVAYDYAGPGMTLSEELSFGSTFTNTNRGDDENPGTKILSNSTVNVVSSSGNKYVFNDSNTYNSSQKWTLKSGTYVFKDVPPGHPMAILNSGKTDKISYSGDASKKLTTSVSGTTANGAYDFYYGDITVTVNSDFGTVSIYCYYHGYMGGENLLVYETGWTTDSTTSVDMDVDGEYTVTYTAIDQYGNTTTATRSVTVTSTGIPGEIKLRKDSIRHVFNTVCQAYVKFDQNANLITYNRDDVAGFKIQNNGRLGIGKDDPTTLFHGSICRFEQDFTVDHIILSDSDERLKVNIEDITIPDADKIHDLEPVQYNWKVNPDGSVHFGFIAQDIVDHYPNLVKIDEGGNYSLDYIGFIPLIIKELKRQMDEIDDLTQEAAHLRELLDAEIKKYNNMINK